MQLKLALALATATAGPMAFAETLEACQTRIPESLDQFQVYIDVDHASKMTARVFHLNPETNVATPLYLDEPIEKSEINSYGGMDYIKGDEFRLSTRITESGEKFGQLSLYLEDYAVDASLICK